MKSIYNVEYEEESQKEVEFEVQRREPFKYKVGDLVKSHGWHVEENLIVLRQRNDLFYKSYVLYSPLEMRNIVVREENLRLIHSL
jgi:hypothetical protein